MFPPCLSIFCMFTPCFLESNPQTLSLHGRLPGEPHCRTSSEIVCSTPAIFMQETDNNFKNHILGCKMYTSFLDKFWKKMIWPSSIRILIWRTQMLFKKRDGNQCFSTSIVVNWREKSPYNISLSTEMVPQKGDIPLFWPVSSLS